LHITTNIPADEYISLVYRDIREAHFAYAREIVRLYHGEDAKKEAEEQYRVIVSGKAPRNISALNLINEIPLVGSIKVIRFASSNSDARRLIEGGGIKLN